MYRSVKQLCESTLENNIDVGVSVDELRQLLFVCAQNLRFKFNGEVYRQKDRITVESSLRALFIDVFMAELENTLLQPLTG